MDYKLALMTGVDIPIPECQVVLHQPNIKEISYMGERDFFTGIQCLCIQKSMIIQDESLLANTTNFQIFMTVMNEKQTADKKQCVLQVLTVLFPNYSAFLTPRAICLNSDSGMVTIDEGNFENLQQVLSQAFCLQDSDQSTFNPGNAAAKKIADKLMKARQRVAAQKVAEGGDASALAQYISVLTIGLGSMSLWECMQLTIYQVHDLMERYSLFVNWDIDLRSRLAGGKPDKPAENWMKQIH